MIMTVAEAKQFITTTESDQVLEAKLQALELLIRKYTNNNFQKRQFRDECMIVQMKVYCLSSNLFKVGDTVQISDSKFNDGIYHITKIEDDLMTLNVDLIDESEVLVTKVEYPMDVKMGVVDMLKWELENRDKVGISSESISRHSVTYFNMDGDNSTMGFPKSLIGFLKPYKKAKF